MTTPKYPNIEVQLTGEDGNAMYIIGKVRRALFKGGVPSEESTKFVEEAMSGDYTNVLATAMRWVTVH